MHTTFGLISVTGKKKSQYADIHLRYIHIWEGWERPTDFSLKKSSHKHFKIHSGYMSAGKFSRRGGDSHILVHKLSSKLTENTDTVLGQEGNMYLL